jgi:hypothetical protein
MFFIGIVYKTAINKGCSAWLSELVGVRRVRGRNAPIDWTLQGEGAERVCVQRTVSLR